MTRVLLLILLLNCTHLQAQTFEVLEVKLVATLQTIVGVNEKTAEFCPVVFGNKLYFTSSRPYNKHNVGEDNWDKSGYSNIFYGTIRNNEAGITDVRDIKLLSNKLNIGAHTGPMSFSKTGDTLFFTRVVQVNINGQHTFKPQLFSAVRNKDSWTKIKRLPFCQLEHSFAHPAYDPSKNRLYFVSDKPGGKGKNDIYYTEMIGENWSAPVNVEVVNSESEEKFPFVINGNIFYSSDRQGGKGQLDVYFSSPEPTDYPIKLDGLNSPYDDFGISILPDLSAGYFSSNRSGNDDLYYFTLDRKITVKSQLAGTFSFRSLNAGASNLTVQLYNENGEFVYEQKTDENGYFLFDNVHLDSNFSVRLAGVADDELSLDFYDANGNSQASFLLSAEGAFKYKKLFYDHNGIIDFIPEDMKNYASGTALLSGKIVFEKEVSKLLVGQMVNLVDRDQNIVATTTTDKIGNFKFEGIGLTTDYTIQIPGCQDDLILYIYNTADQIYTQLKCNSNDHFMYRRLRPDLTNNLSLLMEEDESAFLQASAEITGIFTPIGDTRKSLSFIVRAYSESGIFLETTMTDSLGNFELNSLVTENTYKFLADTDVPMELKLVDRYGKQIAKIQEEENKFFVYRPNGFQSEGNLSLIEDYVNFDINLSERYDAVIVYFNTNESRIINQDLNKLNTLLKLMRKFPQLKLSISAYADATASDEYNLILSQKRGEWIANYLAEKGISPDRLTINAYGESKLIDPENDSINRRAELRIYL